MHARILSSGVWWPERSEESIPGKAMGTRRGLGVEQDKCPAKYGVLNHIHGQRTGEHPEVEQETADHTVANSKKP